MDAVLLLHVGVSLAGYVAVAALIRSADQRREGRYYSAASACARAHEREVQELQEQLEECRKSLAIYERCRLLAVPSTDEVPRYY